MRRVEGEEWRAIMITMRRRFARTLQFYACQSWSVKHTRNQWRYIHHRTDAHPLLSARIIRTFNEYLVYGTETIIPPRWKKSTQHFGRPSFDCL